MPVEVATPVPLSYRILFVCMIAVMAPIGFWGLVYPADILQALPFAMPPLHARFVGGLYASACVGLVISMFASRWIEVRTAIEAALVWTGWLLLVTLLNMGEFDLGNRATWIWLTGYVGFPIVAGWLRWRDRHRTPPADIPMMEGWIPSYLLAQGVVLTALAAVLFLLPGIAARLWPWNISIFLTQLYSGPLLAYGLASICLARRRSWLDARLLLAAMAAFAVLTLVASFLHRELFSFWSPSTVVWFAGFGCAAAVLLYLTACSFGARQE